MRALAAVLSVAGAAVLGLVAPGALAYDEAGHFGSAYGMAQKAQPSELNPNEQLLVALCAQLPDMAADLDAVSVYGNLIKRHPYDWARWGWSDSTDSAAVQNMITVQHLLHGLTGGNAQALQKVARATVAALRQGVAGAKPEDRPAAVCALGLGLHFLGDSYAHQQLDDTAKGAEQRRMYATGKGHAGDAHYPDYALCARPADTPAIRHHCEFSEVPTERYAAWRQFLREMAALLGHQTAPGSAVPAAASVDPAPDLRELGSKADDWNYWGERDMRKLVDDLPNGRAVREFIEKQNSDRPCSVVLADALALQPLQGGATARLSCESVWARYQAVVTQAYAAGVRAAGTASDQGPRGPIEGKPDEFYKVSPLNR